MKANGLVGTARRTPVMGGETSWTQAYEKRMRRLNLEVIVLALSALAILTAWWFIVEWAFFKMAVLPAISVDRRYIGIGEHTTNGLC